MSKERNGHSWRAVAAFGALALVAACGGGGDDDATPSSNAGKGGQSGAAGGAGKSATGGTSGAAGNLPAVTAACHNYCSVHDHCDTSTTVQDCYGYFCHEDGNGTPVGDPSYSASCQSAGAAYYQCLASQPDSCNDTAVTSACQTTADTYGAACN